MEHRKIAVPDMLPVRDNLPVVEGDHNLAVVRILEEAAGHILTAVGLVHTPVVVDVDHTLDPEGDTLLAADRTLQEHHTALGEERCFDHPRAGSLAHLECRTMSQWRQASA